MQEFTPREKKHLYFAIAKVMSVLKHLDTFTLEELENHIRKIDQMDVNHVVKELLALGVLEKDETDLYSWVGTDHLVREVSVTEVNIVKKKLLNEEN